MIYYRFLWTKTGVLTDKEARKEHYLDAVHKFFKPELINRIDEIIVFNSLGKDVQIKVAEKFLRILHDRIKDEKDAELVVTDAAKQRIIEYGVDPQYGARPMRRHIQRAIETEVAKVILAADSVAGKTIRVDADKDGYHVTLE